MKRRACLLSPLLLLGSAPALALSWPQVSQLDAAASLRAVLDQVAQIAVKQLGVAGGFGNNNALRIRLPGQLDRASDWLKRLGMGAQINQLEQSMNAAAEQAVVQGKPILVNAIKSMSFGDAKSIVMGGDTAGTAYLERTSRTQLTNLFLPVVRNITSKTALSSQYNALVARVSLLGVTNKDFSVESYVTDKALDGLFQVMGEKESYIRKNPAQAASSMAQKVLDALLK